MTTTLVLGGGTTAATSHALSLLPDGAVTMLAPGPAPNLPDGWTHLDSTDFTHGFIRSRVPVFIPSLHGWLNRIVDDADAWDDRASALTEVTPAIEELATLWGAAPWDAVAVTEAPSMCCAPEDARVALRHEICVLAADRIGAASGRVHLLTAGRILDLSSAPRL